MKTLLTLLTACLLLSTAFAQAPTIEWQTTIGYAGRYTTKATAVDVISSGGYIVAGISADLDKGDGGDYFVAKLSSTGGVVWQRRYGGTGADIAYAVKSITGGGFIVAGASASHDGDVECNHGLGDVWIIKLDSIGNITWQNCYGGSDIDNAHAIQLTSDGGYIIAGTSNSIDGDVNGTGSDDAWVFKIDSSGIIQWQNHSSKGNAIDVKIAGNNRYIAAGSYGIGLNNTDAWISYYDSLGNIAGGWSYGGNGTEGINAVQPIPAGKFFFAGYESSFKGPFKTNHGNYDFMVGCEKDNIKWLKCLGGSEEDRAYSLVITTDGGCIAAGYTNSSNGNVTGNHGNGDYWLVKLDSLGNLLWQKTYGGSGYDDAYSIQPTDDGGYIVAGTTISNDGDITAPRIGFSDAWIIKLSPEALPVTLINFTAQTKQPDVLLKWQTATEQNSKLFNIQRSTNGQQFTNIGTVPAAGSSNTLRTYNYTDDNALALNELTLYYRIEEMDNDGKKMYSKIVTVTSSSQRLAFTMAGNPVRNTINLKANIQSQAAVKLTDLSGKIIYTGTKIFYPNSNVGIPAIGLVKGIYLLTIQSKGIKTTMKVLVE